LTHQSFQYLRIALTTSLDLKRREVISLFFGPSAAFFGFSFVEKTYPIYFQSMWFHFGSFLRHKTAHKYFSSDIIASNKVSSSKFMR
jgi:hypothetical protein